MNIPESEVLIAIRTGNQKVYEQVFHQYYASLCRFSMQYLSDPEEAREVVQELFLTLWEKRNKFSINTSLKSYLYQSTRNKCLNHLKHLKVREAYANHARAHFDVHTNDRADTVAYANLENRVQEVVASLPERCRQVFELSRYEGLKYKEIAEVLQISPKTVEVQMVKALKTMRAGLKDYLAVGIAVMAWVKEIW